MIFLCSVFGTSCLFKRSSSTSRGTCTFGAPLDGGHGSDGLCLGPVVSILMPEDSTNSRIPRLITIMYKYFFLKLVCESKWFFNDVKTINDGLLGVQSPLVCDGFVPDFNIPWTERSNVKIGVKLVPPKVVFLAVLIEHLNKQLLGYKHICTKLDVRRL